MTLTVENLKEFPRNGVKMAIQVQMACLGCEWATFAQNGCKEPLCCTDENQRPNYLCEDNVLYTL